MSLLFPFWGRSRNTPLLRRLMKYPSLAGFLTHGSIYYSAFSQLSCDGIRSSSPFTVAETVAELHHFPFYPFGTRWMRFNFPFSIIWYLPWIVKGISCHMTRFNSLFLECQLQLFKKLKMKVPVNRCLTPYTDIKCNR